MPTPSPSPLSLLSPPSTGECLARYGIRDTWVDLAEAVPEIAPITMRERVDLLMEDRIAHQETIMIVEEEAYASREAWGHSIRLSRAVHSELQTHRELVRIMAPVTRQGPNVPPNNTNPNNMSPESFVANETEKIDKYVGELPNNIYGSVKASKPKTLDETIEFANDLMDQKLRTYSEWQINNTRSGERKPYGGNLPKCTKCHLYHNGPCTQKCHKCNKVGHFARACRTSGNANVANAQRNNEENPKGNGFFECGAPGHFMRDYPKLKNKDGKFISTAFSSLIDIVPTPLGNSYDVELADGKIVELDTIMRGCTLNFLNYPFNIDLMPVELGSFDVIIGIDWLRRCHVMIVCDEKLVRVPYGNETLIFRGTKSNDERESWLTVISCSKAQEYMAKGCQIFLA
nr:hypothetical protein [Tanacetum cinerariifolium]